MEERLTPNEQMQVRFPLGAPVLRQKNLEKESKTKEFLYVYRDKKYDFQQVQNQIP